MLALLINACHEDLKDVRLVLENNKNGFDKIFVICGPEQERVITVDFGVEAVVETDKWGTYWSGMGKGLERALSLGCSFAITLPGYNKKVHISPLIKKILSPLQDGSDIVKTNLFGMWAFSDKAILTILQNEDMAYPWTPDLIPNKSGLKIVDYPFDEFPNEKQKLMYRVFSVFGFKHRYYEERIVDEIMEITSPRKIYSRKLAIQEKMSALESYRLICETFLKFMPPALFSLIVSYVILSPSTGVSINMGIFGALIISSILIFILFWIMLTSLLKAHFKLKEQLSMLDGREKVLNSKRGE